MEKTVQMMKALGDENRFRIFMLVAKRQMCACELLEILDIAGSTLSAHLKVLKHAGLIEQRKDGRWIEYSLDGSDERAMNLYTFLNESLIEDHELLDSDAKIASGLSRTSCSAKMSS